ncbi:bifunctional nuclease family protein [Glutamicibacter sp. JL.03c]|uniref:bifunctional nuclease family protein n=1 Tax=Glutamicibacter sp. JL.03c TaxID=2984842 RepID=UPI0021F71578|nr:bifunctional nuclease family protein [Glutamicibacter sp. JL.03c]UYQ78625.1 bifunctional nuclease family protein [Glutamicibacter sp. JL.03c]
MLELEFSGIRIQLPANQPLLLLKYPDQNLYLPLWIGAPEASAIAMSEQGLTPPRPMTHDLMISVFEALGVTLERIEIVSVHNAVFVAELVFSNGKRVDSRSSDAVALAVRAKCPIMCAEDVLEEAGVSIETDGDGEEAPEEQLREFREFLDNIDPEDFSS